MQTSDVKPASLECITFCQKVTGLVCERLNKEGYARVEDARQTALHTAYTLWNKEGPQYCRDDPAEAAEIIYQEITQEEQVADETSITSTLT